VRAPYLPFLSEVRLSAKAKASLSLSPLATLGQRDSHSGLGKTPFPLILIKKGLAEFLFPRYIISVNSSILNQITLVHTSLNCFALMAEIRRN
jgi:hypothetical protein